MKRFFCLLALLAAVLVCAGCQGTPAYYTKEEIVRYVEDVYGQGFSLEKTESRALRDGTELFTYTFTDGAGLSFRVTAGCVMHVRAGGFLKRAEKTLTDSYVQSAVGARRKEIEELFSGSPLDARLIGSGALPSGESASYLFHLFLNDVEDFREAGRLISKLDRIVRLGADRLYAGIGSAQRYSALVHIYMKPDHSLAGERGEGWKQSSHLRDYEICTLRLSTSAQTRLSAEAVEEAVENGYVDKAKWNRQRVYTLSEDLAKKYPAPFLDIVMIGTRDVSGDSRFRLYYDKKTGTYWMRNADPCQDSEDFPYSYENAGVFRDMVRAMGGSYESSPFEASWRISGTGWQARLKVADAEGGDYSFSELQVERDGLRLVLSRPPAGTDNGTISGRWLSVEDLIGLLDADITINQDTMTAVMY